MTGPAWADPDDAPAGPTAKPTNGADVGWQPSPAERWRSWDARRAVPGPWHVRHDRADGSKAVVWQADDGTPGLDGHALADLVYLAGGALPTAVAVVVTEGEKACDAAAETGASAVGTVCGASSTPGPAVVAFLARYAVTLSPDNDEPGRSHMGRIAAALERAGLTSCRQIDPPDDAPKGWDLADIDLDERRVLIAGARELLGFGWAPEPEAGAVPGVATQAAKPKVFDSDNRFVPAWAGAAIRTEGHVLHGSDGRLWRWSAGVYLPDAEQWAAARLRVIVGKPYRENHRRETIAWLNTFMPVEIGLGDPDVINLANGRLYWRTGELVQHSPDLITAVKLPVIWDVDAVCPTIDSFVGDVLDETLHGLVEEIAGLLLIPDQRYRKAVLLLGGGLNGKSTLLHLLSALLGAGGASSVSLRELDDDRFKAAELFGRLANICGDIDYRQSRASGMFKKIVGGDAITAERKFGQPFSFYPKARLIFSANQVPASSDTSTAWFDRWLVVPMTRRIEPDKADPTMAARLTTPSELSGFLVRAVAGLRRLAERGHFAEPNLVKQALEEYRSAIEPASGFIEEQCVVGDACRVSRGSLYESFSKWSEQQGHRPVLSPKEFARRLREQVPGLDETKLHGRRDWIGIGLSTTEFSYEQN